MAAAASSRVGLIGTGMRKCEEGARGVVMASGDVQYLSIEASVCSESNNIWLSNPTHQA